MRQTIERDDTHQYVPANGRARLRKALANTYSPLLNRSLDPDREIVITTGANEGIFCALMAFVNPGDEVIVLEPFFD